MDVDFNKLLDELRSFINEEMGAERELRSEHEPLAEIMDFDSLSLMQIVFFVESKYPVKFDKNDFEGRTFTTLHELGNLIVQKLRSAER